MRPEPGFWIAPNWPKIGKMTMTSQSVDMTFVNFFNVVFLCLSSLVTGPSFMSVLSLVLELWQFFLIRDWPEIWKSEIPPSEFCTIPGHWGELEIPNLALMSLIKLLNAPNCQVYSLYHFWVINGKPTVGKITPRT